MRCSRAFCGIIAEALRVELWASAGKTRFYCGTTGSKKRGVSSGWGFGRAREKPDFTAVRRAVKMGKLRAGLWRAREKPDFTAVERAVKRGKLRVGLWASVGKTRFYRGATGSKFILRAF